MNRSKIKGMFLGTAIGDALGMPVETFAPDRIKEVYPETKGTVTEYLVPHGHKWFDGREAGTWTDDTQLTLAVAESLIEAGLDMDAQVKKHIEAFNESTSAWGGTTRKAVRNLCNGASWEKSGLWKDRKGRGNGVAMKIAPLAAYVRFAINHADDVDAVKKVFTFVRNFTVMTHCTEMAVCASFAQLVALYTCLGEKVDVEKLPLHIKQAGYRGREYANLVGESDDICQQLELLANHDGYNDERIIKEFGGGNCYCYNSIPFSLMFFLRKPHSIEALYDVVSAGGDADTNGAMVGALLGALNGVEIFPEHLISGLDQADKIISVADRFYECIGEDE